MECLKRFISLVFVRYSHYFTTNINLFILQFSLTQCSLFRGSHKHVINWSEVETFSTKSVVLPHLLLFLTLSWQSMVCTPSSESTWSLGPIILCRVYVTSLLLTPFSSSISYPPNEWPQIPYSHPHQLSYSSFLPLICHSLLDSPHCAVCMFVITSEDAVLISVVKIKV